MAGPGASDARGVDPQTVVVGCKPLLDHFGQWPSFHDAEILELVLERVGRDPFEGPIARVKVFLVRHGDAARGDASNACVATLRFGNVWDPRISGFNTQNVLRSLCIERAGTHPASPTMPAYRVGLEPAYGARVDFVCGSIELVGLEAGFPPENAYSAD